MYPSRLVFTSDWVVVRSRVIIRSVERYDLVKIKPTGLEAEHWFCVWLGRLWSSENCIVGVASRRARLTYDNVRFQALRLVGSSTSASDSDNLAFTDHKRWSRKLDQKKWKRPRWFFWLWFPWAYDSAYDSDFRFSLRHKFSYDSDYVTSENQPLMCTGLETSAHYQCIQRAVDTTVINSPRSLSFNNILCSSSLSVVQKEIIQQLFLINHGLNKTYTVSGMLFQYQPQNTKWSYEITTKKHLWVKVSALTSTPLLTVWASISTSPPLITVIQTKWENIIHLMYGPEGNS